MSHQCTYQIGLDVRLVPAAKVCIRNGNNPPEAFKRSNQNLSAKRLFDLTVKLFFEQFVCTLPDEEIAAGNDSMKRGAAFARHAYSERLRSSRTSNGGAGKLRFAGGEGDCTSKDR